MFESFRCAIAIEALPRPFSELTGGRALLERGRHTSRKGGTPQQPEGDRTEALDCQTYSQDPLTVNGSRGGRYLDHQEGLPTSPAASGEITANDLIGSKLHSLEERDTDFTAVAVARSTRPNHLA